MLLTCVHAHKKNKTSEWRNYCTSLFGAPRTPYLHQKSGLLREWRLGGYTIRVTSKRIVLLYVADPSTGESTLIC